MPFLDLNGLNYFTQKIKEIFATKQDASNAEQNALQRANDFTIIRTDSTLKQAKQYADEQDIFYDVNKYGQSAETVTLFKDKLKQYAIHPKTLTTAILDNNGRILETVLSDMKKNTKIFSATFYLDRWTKSGNYWTQTAECSGMKSSYNTLSPWFVKTGVEETDNKLQQTMNILSDGKIETGEANITAYVKIKPMTDISIFMRNFINV